jgi:hypothetical protein
MVDGVGANATAIGGAMKANTARVAIAIAMRKRTPFLNAASMEALNVSWQHNFTPSDSSRNHSSNAQQGSNGTVAESARFNFFQKRGGWQLSCGPVVIKGNSILGAQFEEGRRLNRACRPLPDSYRETSAVAENGELGLKLA